MNIFFDIEVDTTHGFPAVDQADKAITQIVIGIYNSKQKEYQIFVKNTNKLNNIPFNLGDEFGFTYTLETSCFKNEQDLLTDVYQYLAVLNSSLIGYSITNFDIPYILNRSSKLNLDLDWKKFECIDLIKHKLVVKQSSYALNIVARNFLNLDISALALRHSTLEKSILPILTTIKFWEYLNFNKGYHLKEIEKGTLGLFSKIKEEFLEAEDAMEQDNPLMCLMELSDLLGAIEAFANKHNLTLEELITMKNATKRAFESGRRS